MEITGWRIGLLPMWNFMYFTAQMKCFLVFIVYPWDRSELYKPCCMSGCFKEFFQLLGSNFVCCCFAVLVCNGIRWGFRILWRPEGCWSPMWFLSYVLISGLKGVSQCSSCFCCEGGKGIYSIVDAVVWVSIAVVEFVLVNSESGLFWSAPAMREVL